MKAVNKWLYILCLIFFCQLIMAQDSTSLSRLFKPNLLSDSIKVVGLNLIKHDVNKLPFFCKLEELWSNSSGLNVRFRIGDLQYVNKLEGKK